jgi:hypothetical protein
VVLLHYRVVPGLGATPSPPPRTPQAAVPVTKPIAVAEPDASPVGRADAEGPCDCSGVTIAA